MFVPSIVQHSITHTIFPKHCPLLKCFSQPIFMLTKFARPPPRREYRPQHIPSHICPWRNQSRQRRQPQYSRSKHESQTRARLSKSLQPCPQKGPRATHSGSIHWFRNGLWLSDVHALLRALHGRSLRQQRIVCCESRMCELYGRCCWQLLSRHLWGWGSCWRL